MVRTHSGCPPPPSQIVQPLVWRTVRSNSEPRSISPVTGSWVTSAWRASMCWSRVIYINDTSTIALLMAVTRRQAGDQLALEIIERGKQGQGAVPHVIMGLGANMPDPQRQTRLRALQRLAL